MRTTLRNPISLFILLLSLCLFVQEAQAAVQSERGGGSLSLTLLPETTTAWRTWRPVYNTEVTFVATLSGNDATQSLSDVTYTFTLSEVSSWPGYCMNMGTQTASDKDLEFRKADQPTVDGVTYDISHRGKTLTVTFASETDVATLRKVRFKVRVLDHAAVGKLQATVNKSTQGAPTILWIPRAPTAAPQPRADRDVTPNDR